MKANRVFSLRGFTLVEVMVVIVILGILAALIVPKVMSRPDDARIAAAQQDIRVIIEALHLYKLDNRTYPNSDQGLAALVELPVSPPVPKAWRKGGYLNKLPNDPWGNPYQYLNPGEHEEIDIWSYGADGEPGGEGTSADIGSWQ